MSNPASIFVAIGFTMSGDEFTSLTMGKQRCGSSQGKRGDVLFPANVLPELVKINRAIDRLIFLWFFSPSQCGEISWQL
jgi:hypothetical protein